MKKKEKKISCLYSVDAENVSSRSKSKCSYSLIKNKTHSRKQTNSYIVRDRFTICHQDKDAQLPHPHTKKRTRTLTQNEDTHERKYYLRSSGKKSHQRQALQTERNGNQSSRKLQKYPQRQRMHTITYVDDEDKRQRYVENQQKYQQQAIKGCIAQLQNILVDINNNKNTHRRLLSQRSYKEDSPKQVKKQLKVNKEDGKTISIKSKKDACFKSYLDFIKKRKKQSKLSFVNNMRKPTDPLSKIKKTSHLVVQKQNACHDQQKNGQCQTIIENSEVCSSIQKINQSSFLSELGKKMLKEVKEEETEKKEFVNNWMRKGSGWKKEKKNRSSIKNIFPQGFFI